jgi:hypothetical protein
LKQPFTPPPQQSTRLARLRLHNIPARWVQDAGRIWFAIVQEPNALHRRVAFTSNPYVVFSANVPTKDEKRARKQAKKDAKKKSRGDDMNVGVDIEGGAGCPPHWDAIARVFVSITSVADYTRVRGSDAAAINANAAAPYDDMPASPKSKSAGAFAIAGASNTAVADAASKVRAFELPDAVRNTDAFPEAAAMHSLSGREFAEMFPSSNTSNPLLTAAHLARAVETRHARVDVEFDISRLPLLTSDVVIKFFFNDTDPDTLHCPLQVWLNGDMETTEPLVKHDSTREWFDAAAEEHAEAVLATARRRAATTAPGGEVRVESSGAVHQPGARRPMLLELPRDELDGPHKDPKKKKYAGNFAMTIDLAVAE